MSLFSLSVFLFQKFSFYITPIIVSCQQVLRKNVGFKNKIQKALDSPAGAGFIVRIVT